MKKLNKAESEKRKKYLGLKREISDLELSLGVKKSMLRIHQDNCRHPKMKKYRQHLVGTCPTCGLLLRYKRELDAILDQKDN